jgi:hypothetical protein
MKDTLLHSSLLVGFMHDFEYWHLAISGLVSVFATPLIGGVVMGYLERGDTIHNVSSGVVLGGMLACFLGIPFVFYQAHISTAIGGAVSPSQSVVIWIIIAITFVAMSAIGSVSGGFIARSYKSTKDVNYTQAHSNG